jgi:hypothetical protein
MNLGVYEIIVNVISKIIRLLKYISRFAIKESKQKIMKYGLKFFLFQLIPVWPW